MASKSRGKEKKGPKKEKVIEEPPPPVEEHKDDDTVVNDDVPGTEEVVNNEEPIREPTPPPEQDEPSLAHLIVEHYEGETVRGLYDGEGEGHFYGGHVYKGQFSKGQMHGRGIYTWSDGVVYEGDFTNNEITGKGIYRWPDSSTYEGELFRGKRHGEGAFRSMNSPASYTGQWNMGSRHGTGIIRYDTDGISFYEGDWVNNQRHGYGVRRYRSGNVYEGEWATNNRHGQGVMRWVDLQQTYSGQWENGIQNGHGEHVWYMQRLPGSQYSMRNQYIGDFLYGKRHGYGVMLYANGAKYEGDWLDDKKSGRGVFTFKNGRIFEGIFVEDKMADYPDFAMDGTVTPDLSEIRTRTPDPAGPATGGNLSFRSDDGSGTHGTSMVLDIDHLLEEFSDSERECELKQVMFVVLRHITTLKKAYNYYSSLGHDASPDNTFVMTRLQFWRMLKDCRFHHLDTTLAEIDRVTAVNKDPRDMHSPLDKLLLREYLSDLITMSYHLYQHDCPENEPSVIAWCFDHAIRENIIPYSCDIQGNFLYESARAVNALGYMDKCWMVYKAVCRPNKFPPHEQTLKMREFLFMLKDYGLIYGRLTSKRVLEILSADDPAAYSAEGCNLELEMTFLDFFEALIGCAMVYVTEDVIKEPDTPRPSTVVSNTQTIFSHTSHTLASRASHTNIDSVDPGSHAPQSSHQSIAEDGPSPREQEGSASTLTRKESQLDTITAKEEVPGTHVSDSVAERESQGHESKQDGNPDAVFVKEPGEPDGLLQSVLSMGEGEEDHDQEAFTDNETSEATREFNFWTHQINFFLLHKLYPAHERTQDVTAMETRIRAQQQLVVEDKLLAPPSSGPEDRRQTTDQAPPLELIGESGHAKEEAT